MHVMNGSIYPIHMIINQMLLLKYGMVQESVTCHTSWDSNYYQSPY